MTVEFHFLTRQILLYETCMCDPSPPKTRPPQKYICAADEILPSLIMNFTYARVVQSLESFIICRFCRRMSSLILQSGKSVDEFALLGVVRSYLFRWRTYKSHIHSTGRSDNIPSVYKKAIQWRSHSPNAALLFGTHS